MNLVFNCCFALVDSGGIQEETTYLGIPCITLRPNTERPITITQGTNRLCELENFASTVDSVLTEEAQKKCHITHWNGKTAERVVQSIKEFLISHRPTRTHTNFSSRKYEIKTKISTSKNLTFL